MEKWSMEERQEGRQEGRREGESRVQHPQRQGIGRAQAAVPQPQGLRQRQGRQGKGEEHPHIEQPGPQAAQQPAAAQGKDQSWYQGYGGGKEQTAPAVPPKHAGIKDSRGSSLMN